MEIILGINAYHADAAACLVVNGKLVAAAEEERFRRIKHWTGFPSMAIVYCLGEAGIGVEQIDYIAVNRDHKANLLQKVSFAFTKQHSFSTIKDRLRNFNRIKSIKTRLAEATSVRLDRINAIVHNVEHHKAHISSSYYVSPFESATVVSVDGFGDFVSTMWGEGNGCSINILGKIGFPQSLGLFYLALTQFLGFHQYGEEYKVMGLAPYGKPAYMDAMRRIVKLKERGTFELDLSYFLHHSGGISREWNDGTPRTGKVHSPKIEALLGPARKDHEDLDHRHFDIAASLQEMYEEAFFHLLNYAYDQTKNPFLCIAGGCALNSVANGKIFDRSQFRDLFIQSAAGDGGGAIGAAYYLWHQKLHKDRSYTMQHAYLGPEFSEDYIASLLAENRSKLNAQGCIVDEVIDEGDLCDRIARHIANGKVVGWFQGRMEWGPRALGNRSIICDPRRKDMKKILNEKIKKRESFRPFAPSITREAVAEWFDTDYDVPFMLQVYQIRAHKRDLIPAVVHVNGSGRLQTVRKSQNPRYYRLIKAFETITGVPMVLNTSFNENEPVVCTPQEALNCFFRTKMDLLSIGNWIIEQQG